MKGYLLIFKVLAIGTLTVATLKTSAITGDCPNDPSGNVTFFPNPKNCSEYFACDNGQLTTMECPPDLQFNPELNVCDFPGNVDCGAAIKDKNVHQKTLTDVVCPNDPSGNVTFFPNPKNCSEYFACDNGQLTTMECPPDLQFNPELNVCDFPGNVNCGAAIKDNNVHQKTLTDVVCPNDSSGNVTFFPNPKNCSEYFACDNGQLTTMECPPDLQFNPELNVCDFPGNVDCGAAIKDNNVHQKTLIDVVCPNDPSGNVTFFPNPKNCSEYFACDNGQLTTMECPPDLQFNPELNVCDFPGNVDCGAAIKDNNVHQKTWTDVVCLNDPSGNVTFFPNPKNCSEYFACDNGQLTTMECPPDLQFNPELNVCDFPGNVDCGAAIKDNNVHQKTLTDVVCPNDPSGNVTFFPNPKNCSEYFACDNGQLTTMECPPDLQFNPELNVCDFPGNVDCGAAIKDNNVHQKTLTDVVCPNDPSGNVTFFPNPKNCSEYFACDNGQLTTMECPPDLQFNPELNVCDFPGNVDCGAAIKDNNVHQKTLTDVVCPNDSSGNVTFFPNPKNCSEYFACDNGQLTTMECPPDLQFNPELNVCDFPENVDC